MTFSIMTQQSAYSFQQLGQSLPSVASMSTSMFEIFESKQNFQFLNFSCWFLGVQNADDFFLKQMKKAYDCVCQHKHVL
jgi:hypothetical protein